MVDYRARSAGRALAPRACSCEARAGRPHRTDRDRRRPGGGTRPPRRRPAVDIAERRARASCGPAAPTSRPTPPTSAEAGRDWWPLAMVWATDGQVGARPARSPGPPRPSRSSACSRCATRPGIPVTTAGGRSSVCGGAVPVHGGVVLDLCGLSGIVVGRPGLAGRRGAGRHVRRPLRGRARRPHHGSPSATGRSRWRCPPSAAGSPAAAPASSRTATARSRTSSSASRSSSPTAASSAPAGSPARRSGPTSTRSSSAPRARSASSPGPGCRPTRRRPTGASAALRLRVVRRRASTPAPHPAAGRDARGPAPLRRGRVEAQLRDRRRRQRAPRARRGRRRAGRRGHGGRRRGVRGRRRGSTTASSTTGSSKRNDVAALEALISARLRRRHHGGRRAVGGAARRIYESVDRRHAGRAGHARRLRPPVALLPDRRLPLLHLRRPGGARRARRASTPPPGTPAPAPSWPRGAPSATTTASGLNRARFVAEALGPAFDVLAVDQGGPRPERHPQPRQARPARPVRPGRMAPPAA